MTARKPQLAAELSALWPQRVGELTPPLLDTFDRALRPFDWEDIAAALSACRERSEWLPTPAEVKKHIGIVKRERDLAEESRRAAKENAEADRLRAWWDEAFALLDEADPEIVARHEASLHRYNQRRFGRDWGGTPPLRRAVASRIKEGLDPDDDQRGMVPQTIESLMRGAR